MHSSCLCKFDRRLSPSMVHGSTHGGGAEPLDIYRRVRRARMSANAARALLHISYAMPCSFHLDSS